MNDLIKLIMFIIYITTIFFFPNNELILIFVAINVFLMFLFLKDFKIILRNTFKFMPFIIFTFLINCLLDTFINAFLVSIKLIIVCNTTIIYSRTTTVTSIANTIKLLCFPLKLFKIDTDDIKIIVCIALSMIPIFKSDLDEARNASVAKNMTFNIRNFKYILVKYLLSILKRVNLIEEALIAKGF